MRARAILIVVGLGAWLTAAYSQSPGRQSGSSAGYDTLADLHSDIVLHADVPLYPQLAIQARVSGVVHLHVLVDNGVVTRAEPNSAEQVQPLVAAATENVKTWRFAPGARGTFDVTYTYELEKTEVPQSVNPKIVMNLPTSVKITAWPVGRACLDCGAGSFESKTDKH
jgi:TonB family protein